VEWICDSRWLRYRIYGGGESSLSLIDDLHQHVTDGNPPYNFHFPNRGRILKSKVSCVICTIEVVKKGFIFKHCTRLNRHVPNAEGQGEKSSVEESKPKIKLEKKATLQFRLFEM